MFLEKKLVYSKSSSRSGAGRNFGSGQAAKCSRLSLNAHIASLLLPI